MPLKIMVVDDEPDVLRVTKAMIEPLGIEVLTVADSRQAAERLKKQKFDGAFIDVGMPHLDGYELTRQIRSSPSNSRIPIVMMTGLDDIEAMRKGFKAGITFFLSKPFNPDKLRGLLSVLRSTMLREKRRYVRLPLRTVVDCKSGSKHFKSGSLNVSESGMLLEISGGLAIADEVDLQFMIPAAPQPLKARAKVVRKEPPDRMGVLFVSLAPDDHEAIQRYIAGGMKD